ncbi:MAG: (d)CMP kinase [Nevskia sp.]|nr:(d)CMP kinase [Nevskia sp.]
MVSGAPRPESRVPVIAVDGPSGAGKGLVTRMLAERLGWHRLDSGALYRVLALAAQDAGIELQDGVAVAALAPQLAIEFAGRQESDERILVNGQDWTARVRAETAGDLASRIAALPEVRAALLQRQRDFRRPPGLVADGRDMGTVVFPDARLKIFLDASAEARARRRKLQLSEQGVDANLIDLCVEVRARDARDRSRAVAPLAVAADAVVLDTTQMKPAEVLAAIEALLRQRGLLD